MRVFVTGATGWVGSAVVQELVARGHEVAGLARSAESAAALVATDARPVQGSLDDIDCLRAGVLNADGVIHTAFDHDWSRLAENCALDRRAIEVMGALLEGSDRSLLVTSGVAFLAPGRTATEEDAAPPVSATFPRASEAAANELRVCGVRAAMVRLAPSVHGFGDHGFVPRLAAIAREKGVSAYIGEGLNHWPAVHRLDAARVYCLALERDAEGPFHAIAEAGVTLRNIAEAIGQQLELPVISKSPAASDRTRALLGLDAGTAGPPRRS